MGFRDFIGNLARKTGVETPSPVSQDIQTLFSGVTNRRQLFTVMSVITKRAELAAKMGKSFGGERDIYEALGYAKTLTYDNYKARYDRQDIAKKIVKLPVAATWRKKPQVLEMDSDPKKETEFEKGWKDLVREKRIWHYLTRVDRISGIGQYGVLFLGFDDGDSKPSEPIENAKSLLYLSTYSEGNTSIKTRVSDTKNERYGMPETYEISRQSTNEQTSVKTEVHHSRIVHVAEEPEESDVLGTPRLKHVYNRLQDLELVAGGSGEMFWRGAYRGMGIVADKDVQWGPEAMTDLEEEIDKYVHDLQRYMRLQGVKIQDLAPQVASPKDHVQVLLELIAGAVDIPLRILIGSERGELASSQDERNWASRIDERRRDHAEPTIIRPLIDRLIEVNVLPKPKQGYTVEWPDIFAPTEKEQAETGRIKAEALNKYVMAPGADEVVPPDVFLERILGFSREEIERINETLEVTAREEEE